MLYLERLQKMASALSGNPTISHLSSQNDLAFFRTLYYLEDKNQLVLPNPLVEKSLYSTRQLLVALGAPNARDFKKGFT